MKTKIFRAFTSILLICSVITFVISGIVLVRSAVSQTTSSTLNVTYSASNVAFTASGYYQKKTDVTTTNLVETDSPLVTSISYTPANVTTTRTLRTANNTGLTLDVNNDYILFTYVFHNDASNGGYCIKVSLTDGSTKSNATCKYLCSDSPYAPADLSTFISSVNGNSAPTDVYIEAQHTKYFYVLVSVTNLYVNSSYTSTAQSGLVWNVESTEYLTEPYVTVTFNKSSVALLSALWQLGDNDYQYSNMSLVEEGISGKIGGATITLYYQIGDAGQSSPVDAPTDWLTPTGNWTPTGTSITMLKGKKLFLAFQQSGVLDGGNTVTITISEGGNVTEFVYYSGDILTPSYYSKVITADTSYIWGASATSAGGGDFN